jgi:hypothetical protein
MPSISGLSVPPKRSLVGVSIQRATTLDPNSFDAWFNVGYTLNELNLHGEALVACERAPPAAVF